MAQPNFSAAERPKVRRQSSSYPLPFGRVLVSFLPSSEVSKQLALHDKLPCKDDKLACHLNNQIREVLDELGLKAYLSLLKTFQVCLIDSYNKKVTKLHRNAMPPNIVLSRNPCTFAGMIDFCNCSLHQGL